MSAQGFFGVSHTRCTRNITTSFLSLLTDLVAIPDFLAGAMENWGLITFRETSLLVGKQSSNLEKQVVASVIAHELAHQVVVFACWCVKGEDKAKLLIIYL